MSIYQDHGQSENDFMSGGKNLESGDETYSMTALEVGTICGTIVAFILVMFFVFYCRRIDTRRKRSVGEPGDTDTEEGCSCDCPDEQHSTDCRGHPERRHNPGCHPASGDTSVTESGSTKGTGDFRGGDLGGDQGVECTEMKAMSAKQTPPDAGGNMPIAIPMASYNSKPGSERGLTANGRDGDGCYTAEGSRGSGWVDGVQDGKERLSGIMSKVGSWRNGKRPYSRTEDGDANV